MHHDAGVRQRIALARCAGTQQELPHRRAESHTDGADLGLNKLHGVVDRHAGSDRATRAIDIQPDRLLCVLSLEVEQLGGDVVGDAVVDVGTEDDDPLLEETIEDVGLRRAEGRRFGDLGDDVVDLGHKPEGYRATHPTRVAGDQVFVVTSVAEHTIDRAANARGTEDQPRLDQKSTSAPQPLPDCQSSTSAPGQRNGQRCRRDRRRSTPPGRRARTGPARRSRTGRVAELRPGDGPQVPKRRRTALR